MNTGTLSNKQRGILCVLAAAFFFALMNLFVKLSGDLPVWQKSFFRNAVAAVLAIGAMRKAHVKFEIGRKNYIFMLLRAAAGTLGILLNFYAIGKLNIADASMLNKLSPFFAMAFSGMVLKEKSSRFEWLMVFVAFLGSLFVIRPSFTLDSVPALAGFLGGMMAGLAYTCLRRLGKAGVKGPVIVATFSVFSCVAVLPGVLLTYAPMSTFQLAMLLLAGAAAAGGQFSITSAYTYAPAKDISVFDYTQVVFAAALSLFVLGEAPDALSYVGYAIIIGVAVFKWAHSQQR